MHTHFHLISIFIEVDGLKCFIMYENKAHSYHVQNRNFFPTSDSDTLNYFFFFFSHNLMDLVWISGINIWTKFSSSIELTFMLWDVVAAPNTCRYQQTQIVIMTDSLPHSTSAENLLNDEVRQDEEDEDEHESQITDVFFGFKTFKAEV